MVSRILPHIYSEGQCAFCAMHYGRIIVGALMEWMCITKLLMEGYKIMTFEGYMDGSWPLDSLRDIGMDLEREITVIRWCMEDVLSLVERG